MNKGLKFIIIVISIIFIGIAIGGYLVIKTFGEAFGPDCSKTKSWAVKKYTIQEYNCLGWPVQDTSPSIYIKMEKSSPQMDIE